MFFLHFSLSNVYKTIISVTLDFLFYHFHALPFFSSFFTKTFISPTLYFSYFTLCLSSFLLTTQYDHYAVGCIALLPVVTIQVGLGHYCLLYIRFNHNASIELGTVMFILTQQRRAPGYTAIGCVAGLIIS